MMKLEDAKEMIRETDKKLDEVKEMMRRQDLKGITKPKPLK